MKNAAISLEDKYTLREGRVFVTGTQALVRLALMQRWRDEAASLNTAGFVTGYRGSPLGSVDQAFARAKKFADDADIRFHPGVNEDLAATSVLGTQQINLHETAKKQGVFSIWYGKGPGVDRSGDAFRHGNLAGSAHHGGVLILAGDDHTCKSSTTSHQSEYALMDAMIPILNPAGVQDILDFGLFGWALSRYAGTWAAMKLVADTMDSSASVQVSDSRIAVGLSVDFDMPSGGLSIRWPDTPQEMERRLHNFKIPAALAFARANRLDRVTLGGVRRQLGIVTTGKSYLDVLQALEALGIDQQRAAELGLSIYKVGMVWPLEPEGIKTFATGLQDLLVIEEKRPLLESQIKDILFGLPADQRPRVFGKKDEHGRIVLPAHDDLSSSLIAKVIAERFMPWLQDTEFAKRARQAIASAAALSQSAPLVERTPYFCSGCPHNSSTKVPTGSRALAGIGCHYLVLRMDRDTATFTHMGGEGANWIGQAPYVPTEHVFQNLGDGTYFHSGLLAIRAAVAAKVNITYKILFNDAVAMTGGQAHDGQISPQRISHQVRAEGVERIAIVSDDIQKYADQPAFVGNVSIHHRSELDAVQRELREHRGVSVLIYDQVCAAEKRRRGKRSAAKPVTNRHLFINELVCEGCGDCSKKSNCLSVTPIDTEYGRKRRIDQSTCNTDFSCLEGFCPSFVGVEGASLRKPEATDLESLLAVDLHQPQIRRLDQPWNILITGVGGTGIITIGAIVTMAAHIEGKGCTTLDMTGMAQKGGPVTSHIRLAASPEDIHASRIATGAADLLIGGDLVVTTSREALDVINKGTTHVVLNQQQTITADFIRDRNFNVPADRLVGAVSATAGAGKVDLVAATKIAEKLLGDSIGANLFLVGYAFQRGLIPVEEGSIQTAIKLNRVAVEMNTTAFRLGRLAAQRPDLFKQVDAQQPGLAAIDHRAPSTSIEETISRRVAFLTDYQAKWYAQRYESFLTKVRAREVEVMGREGSFSEAVARGLFKLMAYKDEYEVARLYSGKAFREMLSETFVDGGRLSVHLAPPLFARKDPTTGIPRKMAFGPWAFKMFAALARMRRLRGTPFDPFGYTAERRTERQLILDYMDSIGRLLQDLTPARVPHAIEIASLPDDIAGFGHVKAESVRKAKIRWRLLEGKRCF
ncbi:indolepyruvate ferredoxin oxidoreductase family protein [Hyphococcus luteus]|uniref:Indolepyruvate ferredoxin oxidoreductase n=1 Tax=Hyphococcus luteus TaxID=2058213 RepID=A0A2S7K5A7_9PROT|nr:indolepyruvate ferredoxin oxidoreductase family protein [Marinicaulis flavus]PQA87695.1 indolepyruvate ferredoxin oxidoreductase [Marinicaulis flavus]